MQMVEDIDIELYATYRIYWHIVPPYVARARQMPSLRGGTIQKGVLYASWMGQT